MPKLITGSNFITRENWCFIITVIISLGQKQIKCILYLLRSDLFYETVDYKQIKDSALHYWKPLRTRPFLVFGVIFGIMYMSLISCKMSYMMWNSSVFTNYIALGQFLELYKKKASQTHRILYIWYFLAVCIDALFWNTFYTKKSVIKSKEISEVEKYIF